MGETVGGLARGLIMVILIFGLIVILLAAVAGLGAAVTDNCDPNAMANNGRFEAQCLQHGWHTVYNVFGLTPEP